MLEKIIAEILQEKKGIPPEDRDMGFVFQNFEIFDHMTVWQNVTAENLSARCWPSGGG